MTLRFMLIARRARICAHRKEETACLRMNLMGTGNREEVGFIDTWAGYEQILHLTKYQFTIVNIVNIPLQSASSSSSRAAREPNIPELFSSRDYS